MEIKKTSPPQSPHFEEQKWEEEFCSSPKYDDSAVEFGGGWEGLRC